MARVARLIHEMGAVRSVALAIVFGWCAALIAGAYLVPVYSTSGSAGSGSSTLVGQNGAGVLLVVLVPLVVALIVTSALWRLRSRAGSRWSAWTATGLLAAFNVLALASIGIFVLPVTIGLLVACRRTSPVASAAH